jgi:predicted XRE-type DNA-binding protein
MNLKEWIKDRGVRQWMVAEAVGVTEFTFSRWLRRPEKLKPAVIEKIKAAVDEIAAQKEGER